MSNICLYQNMHFILYSSQFIKQCWKSLKFLWTSSHEFDLNFHCPYFAYKNSVGILRWPRSDSCLLYFSETLMTFCRAFWLIVSHVFFLLCSVSSRRHRYKLVHSPLWESGGPCVGDRRPQGKSIELVSLTILA